MKIIQINVVANSGSTGRIAEGIGIAAQKIGFDSYIAYGRWANNSKNQLIRIGNKIDNYTHGVQSLFFDRHGFGSKRATHQFTREIIELKPDLVCLHNLHGYYIHLPCLFECLQVLNVPVVITLHDCWNFTGHCSYYMSIGCEKWKSECKACPGLLDYPKSLLFDRSSMNFRAKKRLFQGLRNVTIVTPSKWLQSEVKQSFLKEFPIKQIYNGIDLNEFRVLENVSKKPYVLGVAGRWSERKGLKDFFILNRLLDDEIQIILVGLSSKQMRQLPEGIKGISHTENVEELVKLYNEALVFINPTYQDNFPSTNIEALACGTPVITYNTGGSSEAIDASTGISIEIGDIQGISNAICSILEWDQSITRNLCRNRAEAFFDGAKRFQEYTNLFEELLE